MKSKYVMGVSLSEVVSVTMGEDIFEFKAKGRAVWLQRILFWVLRKLKCYGSIKTATVHQIPLGRLEKDFVPTIMAAEESQWKFHREPECIIIGSKEFAELTSVMVPPSEFSFTAEYYQNRTICGLPVYVTPWMSGWVVLPKGWNRTR